MIRNKLSIEHQIDERMYQLLIPHEGNWTEALYIGKEMIKYIELQLDAANKKQDEKTETN